MERGNGADTAGLPAPNGEDSRSRLKSWLQCNSRAALHRAHRGAHSPGRPLERQPGEKSGSQSELPNQVRQSRAPDTTLLRPQNCRECSRCKRSPLGWDDCGTNSTICVARAEEDPFFGAPPFALTRSSKEPYELDSG